MRDVLHDQIDNREELARASRELTDRIVKATLREALDSIEDDELKDLPEVFEHIAEKVADKHAALTTRAVQDGARFAKARSGK